MDIVTTIIFHEDYTPEKVYRAMKAKKLTSGSKRPSCNDINQKKF
jgi:hypothetical protein